VTTPVDTTRLGRCYELAGRYVSQHGGTLVHGTVSRLHQTPPLDHAWVITDDGDVWEPVTDDTFHPAVFDYFFGGHEKARYTQEKVFLTSLRTGHWGPWDAPS
jgi:hypothetical protein